MRRHLQATLAVVAIAGLLTVMPSGASAQDSAASIPGAKDCTVEPRTQDEILSIVEPDGTPISFEDRSSEGELGITVVGPADFETQQAIRETFYQVIACSNAEMPLSSYALYTDDFLIDQVDGDQVRNPVEDEETPPATLMDIVYVQELSDGHVYAVVVVTAEDNPPIQAVGVYFEEVNGRWLMDGVA